MENKSKKTSYQSTLVNIGLVVFTIILLIGGLEISARLYAYMKYGNFKQGMSWVFNYEPYLLVRTSDKFLKDYSAKSQYYRILLLGGSTAQQIPKYVLENTFEKVLKIKVELLNFASGGYIINQENIMLVLYGIRLRPNLIITLDGANDIVNVTKTYKPGMHYANKFIELAVNHPILNCFFGLVRQSQFINSLNKLIERKQEKLSFSNEGLKEQAIERYVEGIHSIAVIAKGMDVPYITVLQPYIHLRKNNITAENNLARNYEYRKDFMCEMLLRMNKSLIAHKFPWNTFYVDGTKAFDNTHERCFEDEVHLVPNGNEILVDYLINTAIKQGFKLNARTN